MCSCCRSYFRYFRKCILSVLFILSVAGVCMFLSVTGVISAVPVSKFIVCVIVSFHDFMWNATDSDIHLVD